MAIANTRPGGYLAWVTAPPSGAGVSLQASAVSWSQTDRTWIGRQFGRPFGAVGSKHDSPLGLYRHADRGWIGGEVSPAVRADCSTAVGASAPQSQPGSVQAGEQDSDVFAVGNQWSGATASCSLWQPGR